RRRGPGQGIARAGSGDGSSGAGGGRRMTYALLTGCLAAIASAILGGPYISYLRKRKLGKAISSDGPESHLSKAGTPTLGGLLIVGVAGALTLGFGIPKD